MAENPPKQEKKKSNFGAFDFLNVGVTPKAEDSTSDYPEIGKAKGFFLFPASVILFIPFLLIYIFTKTENIPLLLGCYLLAFSLVELKVGAAYSINPLAPLVGDYILDKESNKNMFQVSIVAHALFGAFFVFLNLLFLKN